MYADEWLWLAEGSDERERERHRLFDIKVGEVSIVDRAANKRKLLLVKSEDGMKTDDTSHDDGMGMQAISVDPDEDITFGDDPKEVRNPDLVKRSIPTPVKDGLLKTGREGIERLMGMATLLRAIGDAEEKADRPLTKGLTDEISKVASLCAGVTTAYGRQDGDADSTEPQALTLTDDDKMSLGRMLKSIASGLNDLQARIDKAASGEESTLTITVSERLRAAATALGSIGGRFPTATSKGFGLIELTVNPEDIAKAVDGLTMHPDQRDELVARVEKAVDALCTLVGEIDASPERPLEKNERVELPSFAIDGFGDTAMALAEVTTEFGQFEEAEGDEDEDANGDDDDDDDAEGDDDGDDKENGGEADTDASADPAESDASADDAGTDGGDGDGDDAGAEEATEKGECSDCKNPLHEDAQKGKGKKQAPPKCPPGMVWDFKAAKCVPMESEAGGGKGKAKKVKGKGKSKSKDKDEDTDKGDLAKMIAAAVGKAFEDKVAPLADGLKNLEKQVAEKTKLVEKVAKRTPGRASSESSDRNGSDNGADRKPLTKRELLGTRAIGMSDTEIEALEKDDLIF